MDRESGKQQLDNIFRPASIAIVGISQKGGGLQQAGGNTMLESLRRCGFPGKLYPVNPQGGRISGIKAYTSIKDIPGSVDYVVAGISAEKIPQLLRDCVTKKVKLVHIISSGFSESGTPEGRKLEQEISAFALQGNMRILGPNCMGIYYPQTGLSFSPSFPPQGGSVGLICQSGGNTTSLIQEGTGRGLRFSKAISYGNACDINESDLLEWLATDSSTQVIVMYIEGVQQGQRFSQALRQAASKKPIVVLKGGVSQAGIRAISTHTGALAGSDKIWSGLLRQHNVIRVYSLEAMADMAIAFTTPHPPSGKRVGILGIGGGASVLAADDCTNAGLEIPHFPQEIQDKLRRFLKRGVGISLNNPVDLSDQCWHISYDCTKVMLDYEGIDQVIVQISTSIFPYFTPETSPALISVVNDISEAYQKSDKPMAAVVHSAVSPQTYQLRFDCEQRFQQAGIPVYHSLPSAARAISQAMDYYNRRRERSKQA